MTWHTRVVTTNLTTGQSINHPPTTSDLPPHVPALIARYASEGQRLVALSTTLYLDTIELPSSLYNDMEEPSNDNTQPPPH